MALKRGVLSEKSVIKTAASSGRNRMSQGSGSFIGYNFIVAKSSTCVVCRRRYSATISAKPRATSAAATVMMKDDDDLAVQIIVETGKRRQRQVGGVEHQFQGHVNDQHVPAHDDAQQAEAKKQHARPPDNACRPTAFISGPFC